jgi:hypothetical protein
MGQPLVQHPLVDFQAQVKPPPFLPSRAVLHVEAITKLILVETPDEGAPTVRE